VRWFAYDKQDNPKQVTDANGNVTVFKYDVYGRDVERSNAVGNTWTYQYDSRDNMVETVDANGQIVRSTYDELSRLTEMELIESDGVTREDTVTFGYDALGQSTSATNRDSNLAWSYDAANRVETAETVVTAGTVQPAVVLTHSYDAVGNRTGLTHGPDAVIVDGTWSYLHDGNGNLTRVALPTSEHVDLFYDPAERLTRITSANTAEMQVLYETLTGRLGRIAHTLGAATLAGFDYGFDTDGTITSIADAGGTRTFTYDETLQLTGGGYPTATEPRSESYAYDPEGNRTSSHLSGFYEHDGANRLIEDADACYAYDANGNLESKTARVGVAGCIGAVTEYSWDVLNRLTRIDNADGSYAAYRYDAQGRRIEKDVNGALTRYVYDGDAILLEYDGGDVLQARYSHGEEIDQPLAMARDTNADGQLGAAERFFYHTDHLGSVRLLTDAAGAVANRYDYDAFGNWEDTSYETIANPFGFTARERDAESGLMFYRARYYDPKIGRFISEDPIGFEASDANLYRYVFNNPVTFIDPSGLVVERTLLTTRILIPAWVRGQTATLVNTYTLQNLGTITVKFSVRAGLFGAVTGATIGGLAGDDLCSAAAGGLTGGLVGLSGSSPLLFELAVAVGLVALDLSERACQFLSG
jgi:RHS repeat-associated protein